MPRHSVIHEIDHKERALLVLIEPEEGMRPYALEELTALTETAGAEIVGDFYQKRDRPDPAYYIGPGKAEELFAGVQDLSANLVIVDSELSPVQVRNLEEVVKCRVIDRTQLILDIFASRARTREGQLQVELAQLRYRLPRLTGRGVALSRQGGGIGTRGPGETQLEKDRRAKIGRAHV